MGNKKLAVLMICPQFHPLVGGYERAAALLSESLTKSEVSVTVITERRVPGWPAREAMNGYEVRRLYCLNRRRVHMLTSMLAFSAYLLRHGRAFDLWHVHQYGYHAALAVVLGIALQRPVVLKLTSSAAMGIESALSGRPFGRVLRFLHRRVDACIALTREMRIEAIQFGIPAKRVFQIPNGVDGRRFRGASREGRNEARIALGLTCRRMVLFVGRLSPEKNPVGLLEAWASVDESVRSGGLLEFVGDGPEWSTIAGRADQLKIGDAVYLAGERGDVELWYRAADIFVISSIIEGLSNTMIEALASGLPVVSSRVSGSSILLETPVAGRVVSAGDKEQLTRAIQDLLEDDAARVQFGSNARMTFDARFSSEIVAKDVMSMYEQILSQSSSRSKS